MADTSALNALRDAGLIVDDILYDDKFHRCGTADKPHSKNGWYKAYSDGYTVIYSNWREGDGCNTWTNKAVDAMTPEERRQLKERQEQARKEREAKDAFLRDKTAEAAQAIYAAAAPCDGHPYLDRKRVKSVHGLKLSTKERTIAEKVFPVGSILVPVFDEKHQVRAIQYINNDASDNKRFPANSDKQGHFFPIGGRAVDKSLVVCEGLATGLSLHECTGLP